MIAKDIALTAAHCVADGTDGMVVIFGTNIRTDSKDAVRVEGSEVPRTWSEKHQGDSDFGDIAVIRFEGGVPSGFTPAKLAPTSLEIRAGDEVTLAGYGITRAGSQVGAGVLRKTTVKVANPDFGRRK